MKVIVYSQEPEDKRLTSAFAKSLPKGAELEFLPLSAFARGYKKKAAGAFVYIDVAGLGTDNVLALGAKLTEAEGSAWGVIDRSGESTDPAAFFFTGASDYIGRELFRAGVGTERFAAAFAHGCMEEATAEPQEDFPGWAALSPGSELSVRFCYAAVGNQRELLERIGEKRLFRLREDFSAFLEPWAKECGGIVWIKENSGCLALFPPRDLGRNPVLAAFRLLLDRALIGYEVFKLEVPLTFRFAFHSGRTMWRPPGATGTLVSEDVNFIFHLGMKAAGDGYILASTEVGRAVPDSLRDLFSAAGDFEGRSLIASKRFRD